MTEWKKVQDWWRKPGTFATEPNQSTTSRLCRGKYNLHTEDFVNDARFFNNGLRGRYSTTVAQRDIRVFSLNFRSIAI